MYRLNYPTIFKVVKTSDRVNKPIDHHLNISSPHRGIDSMTRHQLAKLGKSLVVMAE
ncbi:hypothetical protein OAF77_01295 [Akkermansiaceae bacterium]|nr:hypothetical protein [Akkermansiaceae bacterium]